MLLKIGQKIGRRDALKREVIEVAAQKGVKTLPAGGLFERAEKERAFDIGYAGESSVGVTAIEVDIEHLIAGVELA